MSNILILYSTTDGHTQKICQKILDVLEQQQHDIRLISIDDQVHIEAEEFDKILIGASIRYGKHRKNVLDFVRCNREILAKKTTAFFTVNVVARKPDKNQPDNNPYMLKFLQQVPWQPDKLAVFAGEIDYKKYHFFDRIMIRLIMYITHGPTATDAVYDFTNWQQVENFAGEFSKL